jgi:hypothetical protein
MNPTAPIGGRSRPADGPPKPAAAGAPPTQIGTVWLQLAFWHHPDGQPAATQQQQHIPLVFLPPPPPANASTLQVPLVPPGSFDQRSPVQPYRFMPQQARGPPPGTPAIPRPSAKYAVPATTVVSEHGATASPGSGSGASGSGSVAATGGSGDQQTPATPPGHAVLACTSKAAPQPPPAPPQPGGDSLEEEGSQSSGHAVPDDLPDFQISSEDEPDQGGGQPAVMGPQPPVDSAGPLGPQLGHPPAKRSRGRPRKAQPDHP